MSPFQRAILDEIQSDICETIRSTSGVFSDQPFCKAVCFVALASMEPGIFAIVGAMHNKTPDSEQMRNILNGIVAVIEEHTEGA